MLDIDVKYITSREPFEVDCRDQSLGDCLTMCYLIKGRCTIKSGRQSIDISPNNSYIIDIDNIARRKLCFPEFMGNYAEVIIYIHIGTPTSHFCRADWRLAQAVAMGISSNAHIGRLAADCCLSISTFKRRFREQYYLSPHRLFVECRMALAGKILISTPLRIVDVAMICGYCNTSHFIRHFRLHYHTTPTCYRRLHTLRSHK